MRRPPLGLLLVGAALGRAAPAQEEPHATPPIAPQAPTTVSQDHSYSYEGPGISNEQGDYRELHLIGGFRFVAPGLKLDVRGTNALILSDREAARALFDQPSSTGLPRRGISAPTPRRRLSPEQIRERLDRSLQAIGRSKEIPTTRTTEQAIDTFRYLYFEGGVTIVRDGMEVLRCDRMWISPLDDRIVVENAELRYLSPGANLSSLLIVRGSKLVKQGDRWTGRDVTLTTCTAAEPHAALADGEVEIIEREGEFEVIARGQTLQVGGTSLAPLPDGHFFTGSQSAFPIKRAGAAYSQKEGVQGGVVLGLPWNQTGGALHEWLTGRPANEFRGDWDLGVGWIETRGVPLKGGASYRAKGLYEGRTDGFLLDDRGENIREITKDFGGNTIDNDGRSLFRTQNRVFLGPSTHLDLVAFKASDPAVYPEFFRGDYRIDEVPETSAYVHHADGNRILTVGVRYNLDDFSYRDNRALAERFVEELPVITYDWIAQPIGETPWGTPIVVDMATEIGQRRSNYDDLAGTRVGDRSLRLDQLIEVSAPFHWGDLNLRPYASGRGTYYDKTVDGSSEGRIAWEAGLQLGTRLSRTWSWLGDDGPHAVRHVIAPKITYRNRFRVDDNFADDGTPPEFFVFDGKDTLHEEQLVRVEVRNLIQRMENVGDKADGHREPRDFLLFDLAQDIWPDAKADNKDETINGVTRKGGTLGLLYYDLLLRPRLDWLPFDTFALAFYGDYDWQDGMRTLDTEVQFGPIAGITWTADYREDFLVEGAVGVTANTTLMDRWSIYASSQRDLALDEWLSYTFGLQRNDHDWSIAASASYNPFSQETTFRIEFVPRFGGLNSGHRDLFGGGDVQTSNFATSY
ncbi:MAG TPA: hypothetical protein VFZ65_12035 [Planctomycetota bacterium]|nr:hypothetical protein [Planctomycetota bacterium]